MNSPPNNNPGPDGVDAPKSASSDPVDLGESVDLSKTSSSKDTLPDGRKADSDRPVSDEQAFQLDTSLISENLSLIHI